jgi:hypothetical protein
MLTDVMGCWPASFCEEIGFRRCKVLRSFPQTRSVYVGSIYFPCIACRIVEPKRDFVHRCSYVVAVLNYNTTGVQEGLIFYYRNY